MARPSHDHPPPVYEGEPMLIVGSLFSGIGGFDLGLERSGMRVGWQVENNEFCRQVLKKHWPNTPCHYDITAIDWRDIPRVDLVCGGFPCQPFSVAGKQRGKADDRYLWPEVVRCLDTLRPTWFLGENVPGLINLALDQVCTDLESLEYQVWPVCIPACAVDAPHQRQRVWIVAHTECTGPQGYGGECGLRKDQKEMQVSRGRRWPREPSIQRVAHGVPRRLDGFDLTRVIEEIQNYAIRTVSDPREVLRILWEENGSPTFQERGTRIPNHVSKTEILQLVLCKLQSFSSKEHLSQESEETSQGSVRSMWIREAFTGPPCRSGLYEQRSKEHPDSLQNLSRLLAQVSHTTWLCYRRAYATDRINRLRGLGNAIVPQIAEILGRMILEVEALTLLRQVRR